MNVIVYGPQGCGKTLNAEKLAAHFGCKNIVEVEDTVFDESQRHIDTLFLTNSMKRVEELSFICNLCLSFDEAMLCIGEPVPIPEFLRRRGGSFGGGE